MLMKVTKLIAGLTLGTLLLSRGATFAQSEPPVIETQPASQTVIVGSEVTFSVTASSTEPLTYQWFYGGLEISGATDSSLVIAAVTFEDAGEYIVGVSNDGGTEFSQSATLTVTEPPPAQTFLDFNNDGKADLLWVHEDGRIAAWLMDGTNFLESILLPQTVPEGWKMAGQADIDQDGRFDFLWQHGNGSLIAWLMDGTNHLSTVTFPRRPNGGWRVMGLNDFNEDGSTDILWQHGNGRVAIWLMDGTNLVEGVSLFNGKQLKGGWKIAGLIDTDDDGDNDILWQHGGGRLVTWILDGTTVERAEHYRFSGKTSSSWRITGSSDFNGDGENDLIWRHSNGYVALWFMNGTLEPQAAHVRKGQAVAKDWKIKTR